MLIDITTSTSNIKKDTYCLVNRPFKTVTEQNNCLFYLNKLQKAETKCSPNSLKYYIHRFKLKIFLYCTNLCSTIRLLNSKCKFIIVYLFLNIDIASTSDMACPARLIFNNFQSSRLNSSKPNRIKHFFYRIYIKFTLIRISLLQDSWPLPELFILQNQFP